MSDVPVGAFLSGGVDSSTNVALMSRLTSQPLRTFSIGFEGFGAAENFHDLPYARKVAREFGCEHEETTITADDCQRLAAAAGVAAGRADRRSGVPADALRRAGREATRRHRRPRRRGQRRSVRRLSGHDAPRRQPRQQVAPAAPPAAGGAAAPCITEHARPAWPTAEPTCCAGWRLSEPFYWGLDVVFSDLEKRRLYRLWRCARPGLERRVSGLRATTASCSRASSRRGFPAADVVRGAVEPAARAAAHARRQVLHGAFARSARAVPRSRAGVVRAQPPAAREDLRRRHQEGSEGGGGRRPAGGSRPSARSRASAYRCRNGWPVRFATWAEERLFSRKARELDFLDFGYIGQLWHRHRTRHGRPELRLVVPHQSLQLV